MKQWLVFDYWLPFGLFGIDTASFHFTLTNTVCFTQKPFQNPKPLCSYVMLGGDASLVPVSAENGESAVVYPLHHGLNPPIARLAISWSRGNSLRVSVFKPPSEDDDAGGKVVEVKLSNGDPEISDAQWRRIAYGSVTPFALLQSRRSSFSSMSKVSMSPSPYHLDW